MAEDAFSAAKYVFRRIPGGVGIAVVAANAVFAVITGVSMVSAAVFGKVAVPEMLRLGYGPRFSVGVVAGSSVLGMLIPPSILLVLYAMLAEVSVGKMFIAGLVPGLFLAFWFGIGVLCLSLHHSVCRPSSSRRPWRMSAYPSATCSQAARRSF